MKSVRCFCAAVLAAQLGVANAAEAGWVLQQDAGDVSLMWVEPDAGHVPVLFACSATTRRLRVVLHADGAGALPVVWSSEAGEVRLEMHPATVQDDAALVADTGLTPAFIRLLRDGQTLSVRSDAGDAEIPLTGAVLNIAVLMRACVTP